MNTLLTVPGPFGHSVLIGSYRRAHGLGFGVAELESSSGLLEDPAEGSTVGRRHRDPCECSRTPK